MTSLSPSRRSSLASTQTDVVPSPTSSSWTFEMLTRILAAGLSSEIDLRIVAPSLVTMISPVDADSAQASGSKSQLEDLPDRRERPLATHEGSYSCPDEWERTSARKRVYCQPRAPSKDAHAHDELKGELAGVRPSRMESHRPGGRPTEGQSSDAPWVRACSLRGRRGPSRRRTSSGGRSRRAPLRPAPRNRGRGRSARASRASGRV